MSIYLWYNTITKRSYVGSTNNFWNRFNKYFNTKYIFDLKDKMAICGAIDKYGYSGFHLYILEILSEVRVKKIY